MLDTAIIAEIRINIGEKGDKKVITKDHKDWAVCCPATGELKVKYVWNSK